MNMHVFSYAFTLYIVVPVAYDVKAGIFPYLLKRTVGSCRRHMKTDGIDEMRNDK